MQPEILFKEESYKIVGACFEVYREKGCGFLEPVYQECMEIELRLQGIPFVAKKPLLLEYKSCPLISTYQPDFICFDKIVLELKAVTELTDEHRAQLQNYLKATGLKLGILANFGHYEFECKNGHRFTKRPYQIFAGVGCRDCYLLQRAKPILLSDRRIFDSIEQAARSLNVSGVAVKYAANHGTKCKGFLVTLITRKLANFFFENSQALTAFCESKWSA